MIITTEGFSFSTNSTNVSCVTDNNCPNRPLSSMTSYSSQYKRADPIHLFSLLSVLVLASGYLVSTPSFGLLYIYARILRRPIHPSQVVSRYIQQSDLAQYIYL